MRLHWLAVLALVVTVSADEPITYTNDQQLDRDLASQTERLLEQGRTAPLETLKRQLNRTHYPLRLERPFTLRFTPEQLYKNCRAGVVVIGAIIKEEGAKVDAISMATGFIITRSGVMVTNYHVVDQAGKTALGVRTFDGQYYGVKEVLAADKKNDIAILQLNGTDFTPLSIAPDAAIGSPVTVISHPNNRFYSVTTGVVSRYSIHPDTTVGYMDITADFGIGSSGAPILNAAGEAIGLVVMTQPMAAGITSPEHSWAMVVKHCAPSQAILVLLAAPASGK